MVVFQPFPMSARIVSSHFWPKLRDERLQLPDAIYNCFREYNQRYQTLKASRNLEWMPSMGSAVLQLQIDNHTVDITVGAISAAIIYLFQEKGVVTRL